MHDARTAAVVAVLIIAPFSLVALVAIVRGYSISLHMKRPRGRGRGE